MYLLGLRYTSGKIKAVYSMDYVKKFREDLDIYSQLQYLIFGQYIDKKKEQSRVEGHENNQG